jgi:GNAT superfamily N-acetyltransferase
MRSRACCAGLRRRVSLPCRQGPVPPAESEAPGAVYRPRLVPEEGSLTIVPANEASWEDLRAIFGDRGYTARCQCQMFKIGHYQWTDVPVLVRMERLREETHCGYPSARTTSGLVAYLDGEPVGWCAVEPRTAYPRLPPRRIVLKARGEDKDDDGVWAVTCFATRAGFRRQGISRALARATVDFAQKRGARAVEAYPMITEPGQEITWGENHVGTRSIFADAGFIEVSHPTLRRVVMRIDF